MKMLIHFRDCRSSSCQAFVMNAFRGTVSELDIIHLWKKIFVDYEKRHENQVIGAGVAALNAVAKSTHSIKQRTRFNFVGMESASLMNRYENQNFRSCQCPRRF
jgi:hypothetical protein